jgi:hypothetical protein
MIHARLIVNYLEGGGCGLIKVLSRKFSVQVTNATKIITEKLIFRLRFQAGIYEYKSKI